MGGWVEKRVPNAPTPLWQPLAIDVFPRTQPATHVRWALVPMIGAGHHFLGTPTPVLLLPSFFGAAITLDLMTICRLHIGTSSRSPSVRVGEAQEHAGVTNKPCLVRPKDKGCAPMRLHLCEGR